VLEKYMNRGRLETFSDGLIAIIRAQGRDSLLKKAVGRDWKGKLSLVLYMVAIATSLGSSWISQAIFVTAALIWLIPDRRIEKRLANAKSSDSALTKNKENLDVTVQRCEGIWDAMGRAVWLRSSREGG
jgi:hypothetical protein